MKGGENMSAASQEIANQTREEIVVAIHEAVKYLKAYNVNGNDAEQVRKNLETLERMSREY
jgi:hypothetical protein